MRIVQLTPGTGNFHCGNCIRDNTLVRAMRRLGHDVTMVPLYLPHMTDQHPEAEAGAESDARAPLFLGGVNVYLQHKSSVFRHTPRWLDRLLDSRKLLSWAARRSDMTSARDLGELTVSMLRGEQGTQRKELDRMIDWLRTQGRVDVVCLSNALLMGLARRIRGELGAKVVCTLAGEDGFLDALAEPYRTEAWGLMQQRARDVDRFIAVSDYYGGVMRRRMALDADRVVTVYNGIELDGYEPADAAPATLTIGYLARMHPAKGLHTLVDAFIALRRGGRTDDPRLCVVGAMTPGDEAYVAQQRKRLADAGLADAAEFHPNVDLPTKQRLLRSMSVLSVPATYGEAFGLYLLEAMASGVPVVQPRHAAFPELIARLGGGILAEPDNAAALSEAIQTMLRRSGEARQMALDARARIERDFTADAMAARVIDVFGSVIDTAAPEASSHAQ